MFWNIVICALAATGLILLGWCVAALALLPVRGRELYLVACPSREAAELEQQCRAYRLLQTAGILRLPMLIIDDGMNEEGRRLAQLLSRTYPNVVYCAGMEREHEST